MQTTGFAQKKQSKSSALLAYDQSLAPAHQALHSFGELFLHADDLVRADSTCSRH